MRKTLLSLLLTLLGCGVDPTTRCNGEQADAPFGGAAVAPPPPSAKPLLRSGEAVSLTLREFERSTSSCGEVMAQQETFKSFSVQVTDMAEQPVDASHERLETGSSTVTMSVRFTPPAPGWYHVVATFEFDTRTRVIQEDHLVAANRLDAQRFEMPRRCERVSRTTHGTFVCDGAAVRDGATVFTLPAAETAAAGSAVWVLLADKVQRFVETSPGQFEQSPATDWSGSLSGPQRLFASETELLILTRSEVMRLGVDGTGAWQARGTLTFDSALAKQSLPPFAVQNGNTLWLAHPVSATESSFCAYALGATELVRASSACSPPSARVMGTSPSAFWIWTGSVVRELTVTDGGLVPGHWLALPATYDLPSTLPSLSGLWPLDGSKNAFGIPSAPPGEEAQPWYLPALLDDAVAMEQYEKLEGFEFGGASHTLVWETNASTDKTVVFVR